jgi:hypothetical protein
VDIHVDNIWGQWCLLLTTRATYQAPMHSPNPSSEVVGPLGDYDVVHELADLAPTGSLSWHRLIHNVLQERSRPGGVVT